MVFYDGAYFKAGNVFFRYKEKRGWFSLSELHSLLERYTASKAKSPTDLTKVVAAHYYDGRTTTSVADSAQLERERDFEMALISAGIVPHFLAVRETPKAGNGSDDVRYQLAQKGVDVQFAIDVLDFAHADRFDVAVLVTGDEDFVPLVHRITSLGKHALVAHFSIDPWTDDKGYGHRGTFCSRALQEAASWCLNFNSFVRDPDWKAEARSLFFKPKGAE
ncbi:MAG: NYN domain-containing protein [Gemmatimonadaceae bacterium]|nr:NYN domain-containing protein [Gemmatimonadaceae bacterium]